MMNTTFELISSELTDGELEDLTHKICRDIEEETGIAVERPHGAVSSGTRGDPITIGVFVVGVLTELTAVGVYDVFRMYFKKHASVTIEITKADGTTIKVSSRDIKLEHIQRLVAPPKDTEETETTTPDESVNK